MDESANGTGTGFAEKICRNRKIQVKFSKIATVLIPIFIPHESFSAMYLSVSVSLLRFHRQGIVLILWLLQFCQTFYKFLWFFNMNSNTILSENTSKSINEVAIATERDNYMTTIETMNFGLIDKIIDKR